MPSSIAHRRTVVLMWLAGEVVAGKQEACYQRAEPSWQLQDRLQEGLRGGRAQGEVWLVARDNKDLSLLCS